MMIPLPAPQPLAGRLRDMYVERSMFADVTFDLDDGIHLAHRALLMARCDPMKAMFQGHFRESVSRVVSLVYVFRLSFSDFVCLYFYPHADSWQEAVKRRVKWRSLV